MAEEFTPIIRTNKKSKSKLASKNVDIKGKTDFGRDSGPARSVNYGVSTVKEPKPKQTTLKKDPRYSATLTQKISPSVNLKISTLKPFLGDLEDMPKATINEIVDLMIDSYVSNKLNTRQQEAFQSMFDTQFKFLKK